MFDEKRKHLKTSVISSETERDRSPTLSWDSRPRNSAPAAKAQSSGKNLVNLGPGTHNDNFVGLRNSVRVRSGPLWPLRNYKTRKLS